MANESDKQPEVKVIMSIDNSETDQEILAAVQKLLHDRFGKYAMFIANASKPGSDEFFSSFGFKDSELVSAFEGVKFEILMRRSTYMRQLKDEVVDLAETNKPDSN